MKYINPFSLLDNDTGNSVGLDEVEIRRAKKRLLAELELDGTVKVSGQNVDKTDALRVIDELDADNKKKFHHQVYLNQPLNNFLMTGDMEIFRKPNNGGNKFHEDSFKEFISPYFAQMFDKKLKEAVNQNDFEKTKELLSADLLVNEKYKELCFAGTRQFLGNIEKEFSSLAEEIYKNPETSGQKDYFSLIKGSIKPEIINLLPDILQSPRNGVANAFCMLARNLNNDADKPEAAKPIFDYCSQIKTDGLTAQKIKMDAEVINQNVEYREAQSVYQDVFDRLTKAQKVIDEIYDQVDRAQRDNVGKNITDIMVENEKSKNSQNIRANIEKQLKIQDLEKLPSDEIINGDQIRRRFAIDLANLGIYTFNAYYDREVAMWLLNKSLEIKTDQETNRDIRKLKTGFSIDSNNLLDNVFPDQTKPMRLFWAMQGINFIINFLFSIVGMFSASQFPILGKISASLFFAVIGTVFGFISQGIVYKIIKFFVRIFYGIFTRKNPKFFVNRYWHLIYLSVWSLSILWTLITLIIGITGYITAPAPPTPPKTVSMQMLKSISTRTNNSPTTSSKSNVSFTVDHLAENGTKIVTVVKTSKGSTNSPSDTQEIWVWDVNSGTTDIKIPIKNQRPEYTSNSIDVSISPKGQTLAVSYRNSKDENEIGLYNAKTGLAGKTFKTDEVASISKIQFSPDETKLIAQISSGINVWNTETGALLWKKPISDLTPPSSYYSDSTNYIFNPANSGEMIVAANNNIWVLNTANGNKIKEIKPDTKKAYSSDRNIKAIAYAPDSSMIAIAYGGSGQGEILLWNTKTDLIEKTITTYDQTPSSVSRYFPNFSVERLVFSKDGKNLIAKIFYPQGKRKYKSDGTFDINATSYSTESYNKYLSVWEIKSGKNTIESDAFTTGGSNELEVVSDSSNSVMIAILQSNGSYVTDTVFLKKLTLPAEEK